jgi:TP901 family phage tail tape measure protein
MTSVTNLGTLMVSLVANATQYQRTMRSVELSTGATMEKVLKTIKYTSVAAAAAMTAIGIAGVREFGKFDEAMTRSVAIMDDVNDATRKKMEEVARNIGRTTRTAAAEAAAGYTELAQAGLDAARSMEALPRVQKFAQASLISMNQATEVLLNTMGGLGLASADASEYGQNMQHVADVLAKAARLSQDSAEGFATALKTKAAGQGRIVGKEIEELTATLMVFAKQGIKAEEAGEKLAQVIRDIQVSSQKAPEIWERFGISVYDATGKMLPMWDIIRNIEEALAPMSDEQQRATLTLLRFQDRSVTATQQLMGFSRAIKENYDNLQNVSGEIDRLSNAQLKSFNAQLDILWNKLKDILITIGQGLTPTLVILNQDLQGFIDTVRESDKAADDFSKTLTGKFTTGIGFVMDVLAGFKLAWLGLQLVIGTVITKIAEGVAWLGKHIQSAAKSTEDWVNKMLYAAALVTGTWRDFEPISILSKEDKEDQKRLEEFVAAAKKANKEISAEMKALIEAGLPSEDLKARVMALYTDVEKDTRVATTNSVAATTEITTKHLTSLADFTKKVLANVKEANTIFPETVKFEEEMKGAFGDAVDKLEEYNEWLQKGYINAKQFSDAQQQLMGGSSDFLGIGKGAGLTGIEGVDQMEMLTAQENLLAESYERQREIIVNATKLTEEQRLSMLEEMDGNYLKMQENFNRQRTKMLLGGMEESFGQMADVMRDAYGEQSGIYKAMFITSKAFAIAQATIAMYQAMAEAAKLGPASIPAMATVAAQMASLIANLTAVAMSFEGGGDTGNGPRSGGLDGKGGFMAMLHPQETVIDRTKPSAGQGGGGNITYAPTYQVGVTQADLLRAQEQTRRQTIADIQRLMNRGEGFHKVFSRG